MNKADILKLMREDSAGKTPDVFNKITSSAQQQGLLNAGQAASLGAAHAAGGAGAAGAGAAAAAGGSKVIIASIIAALAVTAAVGGTLGASLAVNYAQQNGLPTAEKADPQTGHVHGFGDGDYNCKGCGAELVPTEGLDMYELWDDSGAIVAYYVGGIGEATKQDIVIPHMYNGKPVTVIGPSAFYGENITSITLPDTVVQIYAAAFNNCKQLKEVYISESVETIGYTAFQGCNNLEKIAVAYDNEYFSSKGNCLVEKSTKTLIHGCKNSVIPADGSVENINAWAFAQLEGITEISIPASVKTIEEGAFRETEITKLSLSDNIERIGHTAFYRCSNLSKISLPDKPLYIDYMAFGQTAFFNDDGNWENGALYCGKHLLDLKSTVSGHFTTKKDTLSIGNIFNAAYTSAITEITIGKDVGMIADGAFCNGTIVSYHIEAGNTAYVVISGCLVDTRTKTIIASSVNCTIPSDGSVTAIADRAFRYNETIGLTIPSCIKSIGESAFEHSSIAGSIILPVGLETIGEYAFHACELLTKVSIPGTVKVISNSAFAACKNLEWVEMLPGVEVVKNLAFRDCPSLTYIGLPNTLTEIIASVVSDYSITTVQFFGTYDQWNEFKQGAGMALYDYYLVLLPNGFTLITN